MRFQYSAKVSGASDLPHKKAVDYDGEPPRAVIIGGLVLRLNVFLFMRADFYEWVVIP